MSIRKALGAAVLAAAAALVPVGPAAAEPVDAAAGMPAELPVGDRMVPVTYSEKPSVPNTQGTTKSGGTVTALNCLPGWRTIGHGETKHNLVAISGAPYYLRAWGSGNGYDQFIFCKQSDYVWAFYSNGSKQWVTTRSPYYEVRADGTDPANRDSWYVCLLDTSWVEISFFFRDSYMGVDSTQYHWAYANAGSPGGGNLFRRSDFGDALIPYC